MISNKIRTINYNTIILYNRMTNINKQKKTKILLIKRKVNYNVY